LGLVTLNKIWLRFSSQANASKPGFDRSTRFPHIALSGFLIIKRVGSGGFDAVDVAPTALAEFARQDFRIITSMFLIAQHG
jgi:hypothetical protein